MNKKKALEIASTYSMEAEVKDSINGGLTPEQALREWDLLYPIPYCFQLPGNLKTNDNG